MRLLLVLLLALTVSACDGSGAAGRVTFDFALSDDGPVASGRFSLNTMPTADASADGTFTLTATGGGALPPFTRTSGNAHATLNAGQFIVILNDPGVSDSGVQLQGTRDGDSYTGVWGAVTLAGFQEQGTFTATID